MYVGYARGWPPVHFVSGAFHINAFWTRGRRGGGRGESPREGSFLSLFLRGEGGRFFEPLSIERRDTGLLRARTCLLAANDDRLSPGIPAAPSSRCYTYLPTTSSFPPPPSPETCPFVHRNAYLSRTPIRSPPDLKALIFQPIRYEGVPVRRVPRCNDRAANNRETNILVIFD